MSKVTTTSSSNHLVYATVIVFLIVHSCGHVWGLDGFAERLPGIERLPALRPLFG